MVDINRKGMRRVSLLGIALLISVGLLGACSDDDDPDDSGNFQVGNQVDDDPSLDAGQETEDGDTTSSDDVESDEESDTGGDTSPCEDVDCEDGQHCVDGQCVDDDDATEGGFDCDDAYSLGSLAPDDVTSVILDPSGQPNLLDTSCSVDDESPQAIVSFRVDEAMGITARMAHSDHLLVKELRVDSCDDAAAVQWCDHNDHGWIAEPDREYFLIVEAREGWMVGEFLLELTVDSLECTPPDEQWCESDTVRGECVGGHTERILECGYACDEEYRECRGDRCDNPIVVHDTVTVSSDYHAYQNHLDFKESPACSTNQTIGLETVGSDVVFSLPNLSAGQTVFAEIENEQTFHVIGLMKDCDPAAASHSCTHADSQDGELRWEVTDDGDYFLVFNPRSDSSGEFTYTVSIDN